MNIYEDLSRVIAESLTPEESEREKKMLAHPDMRPCDFDGTLEAWLLRLTIWGTVVIKHNNPENNTRGKIVSNDFFLDTVSDKEDNKLFGLWSIDQLTTNRLLFYRNYSTPNGKNYKEEFDIEIHLKDTLQKALDTVKKNGLFGWLRF